jgi:hypothetical protein
LIYSVSGDEIRFITARAGKWMVSEYEQQKKVLIPRKKISKISLSKLVVQNVQMLLSINLCMTRKTALRVILMLTLSSISKTSDKKQKKVIKLLPTEPYAK